jgi:uncharacterized protein (DUF58 family)
MNRLRRLSPPYLITRRGVGVLLVAIALFYLAGMTRVGWLLLFDALLWGVLIVSAIVPWFVTGKLRVARRIVRWESEFGPMAGDDLSIEYAVTNHGRLPAVFVTVRYRYEDASVDGEHDALMVAWLNPGRSAKMVSTARFEKRGLQSLPVLSAEASLPFGLFRRKTNVADEVEQLVLPRAYPMELLELAGLTGIADAGQAAVRAGMNVVGSRRYVPGDPLRSMHWRNSARLAEPYVKEYEDTPDDALSIFFQAEPRGTAGREAVEDAIRVAASVGVRACASGGRVRVTAGPLDRQFTEPGLLLRDLAALPYETGPGLHERLAGLTDRSRVLAIVSADDRASLDVVFAAVKAHPDATVVVRHLTGDAGDASPHRTGGVRLDGVNTIDLYPGQLEAALRRLESAGFGPDTGVGKVESGAFSLGVSPAGAD